MDTNKINSFRSELETLINKRSLESGSDTPDFILADYLTGCLQNFDKTIQAREKFYGRTTGIQKEEIGKK